MLKFVAKRKAKKADKKALKANEALQSITGVAAKQQEKLDKILAQKKQAAAVQAEAMKNAEIAKNIVASLTKAKDEPKK